VAVFVDTAGFYAVLDSDDVHHPAASEEWASLLTSDEPLVTSNYVVVESSALVQRRMGMAALRALMEEALPAIQVEWVSEADHWTGLEALLTADRRGLSLVDCTSFQIMLVWIWIGSSRSTATSTSRAFMSCLVHRSRTASSPRRGRPREMPHSPQGKL